MNAQVTAAGIAELQAALPTPKLAGALDDRRREGTQRNSKRSRLSSAVMDDVPVGVGAEHGSAARAPATILTSLDAASDDDRVAHVKFTSAALKELANLPRVIRE